MKMKLFQVLNVKEWAISHAFLIVGLILISIGLPLGVGYIIGGVWVFALGLCLTFSLVFAKLYTK